MCMVVNFIFCLHTMYAMASIFTQFFRVRKLKKELLCKNSLSNVLDKVVKAFNLLINF